MTAVPEYGGGTSSDAVVVGGRVAGALAAAHLAAAGLDVVVLESAAITSGTISTHFFRGDGLVAALAEVGALDEVLETGPPRLTCDYWYPDAGEQPEVDPPQEPGAIGYCLSVRRETLDPLLAAHVARQRGSAGSTTVAWSGWSKHPTGSEAWSTPTVTGTWQPLVVGADGRRSTVARLVGAPEQRDHPAARVLIYRYLTGYRGPDRAAGAEFSLRGNELAYAFPSDPAPPASPSPCRSITDPPSAPIRGLLRRAARRSPGHLVALPGARTGSAGSWPAGRLPTTYAGPRGPGGPSSATPGPTRTRGAVWAWTPRPVRRGPWPTRSPVVATGRRRTPCSRRGHDREVRGDDRGSRRPEHAGLTRQASNRSSTTGAAGPRTRAGVVRRRRRPGPAGASSSVLAPPAPSGARSPGRPCDRSSCDRAGRRVPRRASREPATPTRPAR